VDLFSLGGTLSSFNKQGIELSTRLIVAPRLIDLGETEAASTESSAVERDDDFTQHFYLMERLASVKKSPVLLERFRFSAAVFPFFDQNKLTGRSLSQVVLERYRMEASSAEQSFSVTDLNAEQARLLELKEGSAVLCVQRTLHFPQALNAVRATMWCRTDQFRFSQKLGA
jgi:GntR family transcriptional regulator